MENQFCVAKKRLNRIFWGSVADSRMRDMKDKFSAKFSLEEICEQFKNGKGEVVDYYKKKNEKFSEKTENDEIANAITLADFYFPDSDSEICFEMKRGFKKGEMEFIEDLINNMESNTDIDCLIKDEHKEFKFQLKQYPEKYKEWSPDKVIEYLDEKILPESKYNNQSNKDLIIVVTIKPEQQSNFKESEDFDKIYKNLKKKDIKLSEINFLYNRNSEYMVWFQVFPQKGYCKIPWQNLSYHGVKK